MSQSKRCVTEKVENVEQIVLFNKSTAMYYFEARANDLDVEYVIISSWKNWTTKQKPRSSYIVIATPHYIIILPSESSVIKDKISLVLLVQRKEDSHNITDTIYIKDWQENIKINNKR